MIYIGDIPNSILETHWNYFKKSDGYIKIEEYKNDYTLTICQRALFRLFFKDQSLLKKLLLGNPFELRQAVTFYNKHVICKNKYLRFYNDFFFELSWNDVWIKINKKALKDKSVRVMYRKQYLERRFAEMENVLGLAVTSNYNISSFKRRYKNIQSRVIEYVEIWNEKLFTIFDYNKFIIKGNGWNAYEYTMKLGVTVCPYCNRNYIHTVTKDSGSTRAELDHFYPKSLYPFLSISLYNLIPSCHVCNSNLKGAKNFFKNQHLHPFENKYQNEMKFKLDFEDAEIKNIYPNLNQFNIDFELNNKLNEFGVTMINNSIETFKTKELYNYHKDIAQEIIFKTIYYNETKREELIKILGKNSGIDENFIDRVVYGNYIQQNDFGKRPLAKFTSDIIIFLSQK
jgi:hypothetical protein